MEMAQEFCVENDLCSRAATKKKKKKSTKKTKAGKKAEKKAKKAAAKAAKQQGSKKYMLKVRVGGKKVTLGRFATAEQAALFYARREAGRDTSDLTAPPPPPPPPAPSSAAGAELG